jgi:hypothetical protein
MATSNPTASHSFRGKSSRAACSTPATFWFRTSTTTKTWQGAGTTILRISPNGATSLFFQGQTKLGLTAALAVLQKRPALVGNLATADGASNTVRPGSLLVSTATGICLAPSPTPP